jgi:arylsulfatase A-like enzyme
MAPLGYALLFGVLSLLTLPSRRHRGLRPVVLLCSSVGLIGWVTMLPWPLHFAAALVLAMGVAVQLSRLADRHEVRVTRAARRVAPAVAILAAVAAGVVFWRFARMESSAYAALPVAEEGAPNILLLVLDTVRARSLGLHGGDPAVSPALDGLAGTSVVFDRAMATSPWTLPSHGSMFTGLLPHELSVGWTSPLDDAEPTLAERLANRGYATAGFVANLSYTARPFGLDRGFARYEDFPVSFGQMVLSTSIGRTVTTMDWLRAVLDRHELLNRKTAADINEDFLGWADDRPDRPFFAFLNYFDAHEPYEPPADIWDEVAPGYRRETIGHRHNLLRGVNARRLEKWQMPSVHVPLELALYEGAIRSLDLEIGRLMEELEGRGLLQNTVVVITSDHGEHFGEHDLFEHGQSLYQAAVHVPLIVRPAGGIAGGRRVVRPVSIRDIPSTLLDMAGDDDPAFPGSSLRPTWSDDPAERADATPSLAFAELSRGLVEQPWYPIGSGLEMQSVLSGSLYYICNPDASEELFDLATDPGESDNLAGTAVGDRAIRAFRAAVAPVGAPPRWCPPPPEDAPRRPNRGR